MNFREFAENGRPGKAPNHRGTGRARKSPEALGRLIDGRKPLLVLPRRSVRPRAPTTTPGASQWETPGVPRADAVFGWLPLSLGGCALRSAGVGRPQSLLPARADRG